MAPTDDSNPIEAPARRRWRRLGFVLIILAVLETAGWVGDYLLDFRQKLLWQLALLEIETEPVAAAIDGTHGSSLWIRDSDKTPDPAEPYRVGRTTIEGAGPWIEHRRLTPATCPGSPGKRTFILGGSAAFGYPYRHDENLAAQADRPADDPDHRVLNAARVGANSSDIVPIARTILEHYDPATLVIFAGNNEWFHWRPSRPGLELDDDTHDDTHDDTKPGPHDRFSRRSVLVTLAHSRALAAVMSGLLHLLYERDTQAAPLPVLHDDGFVEHHDLLGAQHAFENPLTPLRYDSTTWPETRQKYLDRFRDNLATIVTEARRKNVRVILMTMPFQYRLAPAWKQRQPLAADPDNLKTMTRLIHETLQLQEQDLIDDALLRIQFAIKIDPDAPVAHYVEAELLESLGRPGEAEAAYARSREMTIGNLGSQLSINRVIREVAADQQAELVDLRKIFDDFQHNRKRHFNVELIHDDCHPTPLAHSLIAHHLMLRLFTPGTATAPPTAP